MDPRDGTFARQSLLDEQVKDLQLWCDAHAIIPTATPASTTSSNSREAVAAEGSSLFGRDGPVSPTSSPSAASRPAKRSRNTSMKAKERRRKSVEVGSSDEMGHGTQALNGQQGRLLTDAEKRANHIASEQKRRAAIREGYDQLSLAVPVLRDALREYDARVAATCPPNTRGTSTRRRKGTAGSGPLQGGIEVGGEKIDGRAGPKSEAVVLTQTVDYLKQMQSRRDELLARLGRAQRTVQGRGLNPGFSVAQWSLPYDEQDHIPSAIVL